MIAVAIVDPLGDLKADSFIRWVSGKAHVVLVRYAAKIIVGDKVKPPWSARSRTSGATLKLGVIGHYSAQETIRLSFGGGYIPVISRESVFLIS